MVINLQNIVLQFFDVIDLFVFEILLTQLNQINVKKEGRLLI